VGLPGASGSSTGPAASLGHHNTPSAVAAMVTFDGSYESVEKLTALYSGCCSRWPSMRVNAPRPVDLQKPRASVFHTDTGWSTPLADS